MKIPEAPGSDDPLALAKFHGEVVGALSCEDEKNNRLQQLVDHIHNEQSGMIAGVKTDLNGGLADVRVEIQKLTHNVRDDIQALHKDIAVKEKVMDDRLDHAVSIEDHKRMGERFDGVNDRFRPLEKLQTILIFSATIIVLLGGTVFNIIVDDREDTEKELYRLNTEIGAYKGALTNINVRIDEMSRGQPYKEPDL